MIGFSLNSSMGLFFLKDFEVGLGVLDRLEQILQARLKDAAPNHQCLVKVLV